MKFSLIPHLAVGTIKYLWCHFLCLFVCHRTLLIENAKLKDTNTRLTEEIKGLKQQNADLTQVCNHFAYISNLTSPTLTCPSLTLSINTGGTY